jgi:sulfite reductase alpha subunit-like flavoprotein
MVDFLDSFKELLLQPFFDDTPVLRIADILSTLNRLQPRFYSISSSNKVSPDVVAITVGVLREKTSKGVMINGVCSNYLASLRRGEDQAIIQVHKSSFRLPSDPQSSIIMVGAGTGLSPMMGFLADKALDKDQGGKNDFVDSVPHFLSTNSFLLYSFAAAGGIIHLFFGCRTMQDLIYKEEIEEYEAEGLICFHHALSRGPGPKTYVQDKIKQLGIEAADLLLRKDTHYYVCGDARMANSCYEYCVDVLRKHAGKSRVGAAHYLKQMQAQGRWQTDVWGIVSNYENAKKLVMNSKRTAAKIWLQQFEN